ncbi:MAG: hypothetical protein FWG07_05765 [Treponema sp.]|nr:hypothetical protein [Treponema sp.]
MYKIALICEHGASTGICVRKMIEASSKLGIESDIAAHSAAKLESIINDLDCILLAPQLAFKLDHFKKTYPEHVSKMTIVNSMDFGMMDGEKILKEAVAMIEKK